MEKPFNIIFVYVVWNDIPFQRGKKKGKQEKIGMRSWFMTLEIVIYLMGFKLSNTTAMPWQMRLFIKVGKIDLSVLLFFGFLFSLKGN